MGSNYHAAQDVVVNNHFSPVDPLMWGYAVAAGTVEVMAFFDHKKRLLHHNNRFGTLDSATDDDLLDIFTLFRHYSKMYHNADECLGEALRTFQDRCPRRFELIHSLWVAECRFFPAMNGNRLGGAVLLEHRIYAATGTDLQDRKRRNSRE